MHAATTQIQPTTRPEDAAAPQHGPRLHDEFNRWSRRLAAPAISVAPPIIVGAGRPESLIDFHHLFLHGALNAPEERPR